MRNYSKNAEPRAALLRATGESLRAWSARHRFSTGQVCRALAGLRRGPVAQIILTQFARDTGARRRSARA